MKIITYKDVVDKVYDEFPEVYRESIRNVCRHGLALFVKFKKLHHDIYLNNNREELYYYFGKVTNDELKRYQISKKKVRKKLRLVYSLKKIPFSGYYYFVLDETQYQKHLANETIEKVVMFRVLEEAKLYRLGVHVFQVPHEKKGWFEVKYDYDTREAEYINETNS